MPLIDINNPAIIIFLIENYEKESRLRLNWINKHRSKIQQAATLNREPTNYFEKDVDTYTMVEGLATITRDHIVSARNRRKVAIRDGTFIPSVKDLKKGHSLVDVGLGDPKEDPRLTRPETDLTPDPIMRPVHPEVKEIIYKPKPEFGRLQYIEKRNKTIPEKKYYFPQCTYWDYGWRVNDTNLSRTTGHGKVCVLTKANNNKVGPQPDPSHYRVSEIPGVSKFSTV